VEADILVRHPLAEYLRGCGYIVMEAAGAEEARTLASSDGLGFDVALIDATSTDESGFTLAQWLRKNYPAVSIAMVSNIEKATDRARELCDDGPNVTKPYDHRAVLDHIKRLLAARERAQ
jgi:DNA-binding response OmpR family regulator